MQRGNFSKVNNHSRLPLKFPNKLVISSSSICDIPKIKTSSQDFEKCGQSTSDSSVKFIFKHVKEEELQAVVKQVRRARQKKLDEEKWQEFVRWKQFDVSTTSSDHGICLHCNMGEEIMQSQPQSFDKDMSREEHKEIQESRATSTVGADISENIGNVYQLGGVLTKRLQDLVTTVGRMTSLLLSSVTTRSVQYEDEDVDRAIKRSLEFDAMFARNHLYEIQRLLKDSKQLAAAKSLSGELESKLSAALKCVAQAIQVYAKHVSKGARVKYQQVVPIFQSISVINSLLEQLTGDHAFPFRQELEVSCSYMKQLLLEMSSTDTQSVTTVSRKPARPKPTTRHKPSADLSMYNRRRGDWRRKTASLARAKFGPPLLNKQKQNPDCKYGNRNLENNRPDFNEDDLQQSNCKVLEKCQGPVKESVGAKEVQYRNATRAVPEENVTTMMEMIPNEPIEDGGLNLDDSTFQALKRLNPTQLQDIHISQLHNDEELVLVEKIDQNTTKPSASKCTINISPKSDTKSPVSSKPTSARSVQEPNNVQLVCIKEGENRKNTSSPAVTVNEEISKDDARILTIDEQTKKEAMEYRQSMINYHKVNPHYKDGKALGIVDRLATRILTEMVLDFQKEEMNNVIQTLYNLEFQ